MNDDNFDPQDGADSAVPFARLKPEIVLDALDSVLSSVGVYTDGRMLPLNSYENRVYQVGVEDVLPSRALDRRRHSRRTRFCRRSRRARNSGGARACF
jgi:hypothetical protein